MVPIRLTALTLAVVVATGTMTSSAVADAPPMGYGQAEVAVGTDQGRNWNPVTGQRLSIVVHTRVRAAQVGKRKVFVRYFSGTGRCGASYALGRGRAYGPMPILSVRKGGYASLRMGTTRTFAKTGRTRFCVWVASTARAKVQPIVQDIRFVDVLFGATLTGSGSFWFAGSSTRAAWASWYAVSTRSFQSTATQTNCSGGSPSTSVVVHSVVAQTGFATQAGAGGPVGTDTCNESRQFSYRRMQGIVGQLEWGSVAMSGAERRRRPPVVKSLGPGCALNGDNFMNVPEAKAAIVAAGCRVGRVIRRSSSRAVGQVFAYEIHGAQARLATRGSKVDLVVSSGR